MFCDLTEPLKTSQYKIKTIGKNIAKSNELNNII